MYRFLIKAVKKKIMKPGSRGGKYWIDRKGTIRYDIKGMKRPRVIDMGSRMFEDSIAYFVAMAKIIAGRAYIPVTFDEGQPVGDFADLIASGRYGALKGYLEYFKKRPKNIDLVGIMRRRASLQMTTVALKLSSIVRLTNTDRRHHKTISGYIDDYYKKTGDFPTDEDIADNVKLYRYKKGGKMLLNNENKLEIVRRLKNYTVNRLPLEQIELKSDYKIKEELNLPSIERFMKRIRDLNKRGKITDIGYKIIQMRFGLGKWKKEMRMSEIGEILGLDRRTIYGHFKKNAEILKPYFEKYRGLLEKSLLTDRVELFLKEILEI